MDPRPHLIAGFMFVLSIVAAKASDIEDLIKSTFRNSILKIEVSNNAPVFDADGVNICRSEGTGFLISSQHVVTAEHVFKLSDKCTDPVIIIESRLPNTQRVAQVVGSYNDVALLKITEPLPPRICALRVLASNVYASKGLRFGIPHDLKDPQAVAVDIGEQDNEFSPMIVLTPNFTEHGESGGPVVFQFNVVGVTRAKSEIHAGYSFMESGDNIRYLMHKYGVVADGKTCNPAEMFMYNAGTGDPDIGVKVNDELSPAQKATAMDEAGKAVTDILGSYVATGAITLSRANNAIMIVKRRGASPTVSDSGILGGPNSLINNPNHSLWGEGSIFGNSIRVPGNVGSSLSNQSTADMLHHAGKNNWVFQPPSPPVPDVSLAGAATEITTKLEISLWDRFVKENTRGQE